MFPNSKLEGRYKPHDTTQRQRIRHRPGIRGNLGRDDPLEPPPARLFHRLGLLLLCVTIAVVRLSSVDPPRPIVVRVDAVGRAEALAYETVEAQADPRDPTTKYFLNRFLHDHFGRRRATAQEYWPRSLRFLTTDWPMRPSPPATRTLPCWPPESPWKNSGSRMSCFGFRRIPLSRTGRWPTSS